MTESRAYFFVEFLPIYWAAFRAHNVGLKTVEKDLGQAGEKLRRLTGFFDKVGWLGAAGLIDVDAVLAPNQHTMRRVWIAVGPLIGVERKAGSGGRLDPVYRLGFEWLFRRSEQQSHHQADLLMKRFQEPALLTDTDCVNLRDAIQTDEADFRDYLDGMMRAAEAGDA